MASRREIKAKLNKALRKLHHEELILERARSRRDYWRRVKNALELRLDAVESGQTEMGI